MREPVIPQFDAETYLMWETRQPERFELHHGFVVAFAGGTLAHDRIALNVRIALDRLFAAPCRSTGSDFKIRASVDTYYYPDASVVCDQLSDDATSSDTPRVVVEVLSPGTSRVDRIEKRAVYRTIPSLHAYVIVSTETRRFEVDLRGPDGAWRIVYLDDAALPLGAGELTPDEVYARTDLA